MLKVDRSFWVPGWGEEDGLSGQGGMLRAGQAWRWCAGGWEMGYGGAEKG